MTITKVSDLLTSSDTADLGLSTIFPMYQVGNSSTLLGKPVVQVGDKTYLRSGAYTAPANADSSVLDMQHLKMYSTTQVNSQVFSDGLIYNIVSNEGSTLVATGQGKISYSTDNGVTWSAAINVGHAQNVYAYAVWTGSRFVIANNNSSGSVSAAYHSADGVTWTASTGALPASSNGTTDVITDKQGRVLIVNSSTSAFYSTDHGVSFSSITLPVATASGFVINGSWVFLQRNSSTYYTAPVATPTVGTSRTLPAATISMSRNFCCSNGVNLGVIIVAGIAYTTTDGVTWSAGNSEVSHQALSVYWGGSRFYFSSATIPITNNGVWVPYTIYESSDLNTFREMFLVPARIGTASHTVGAVSVGAVNDRLFFSTQGSNTLPLRYLDYKTTADFIGTNKVFRTASLGDGLSAIYYWRIK